jgi:hypothetical protein
VQVVQRAQGILQASYLLGGGAVGVVVVTLREGPVAVDQFGNGQVGGGAAGRQFAAVGLPLQDDALVLGPAGGGVVLAQEHVAAAPIAV